MVLEAFKLLLACGAFLLEVGGLERGVLVPEASLEVAAVVLEAVLLVSLPVLFNGALLVAARG